MKLLKKLLGTDKVIDSVGGIIDDLVTTKEEKIQAKTKLKEQHVGKQMLMVMY